jgi:acetylornithine aminotransferase
MVARWTEMKALEQGIDALISVVESKQKAISGLRPAQQDKAVSYGDCMAQLEALRGAKNYNPYCGSGMGKGPYVQLADGSVKLDFIGGIGVHFFGHQNLGLMRSLILSSLQDTVMQGHLQQNEDALALMQQILELANLKGAGFDHVTLTSSGAMANENALKILLQKNVSSSRLLAFSHCFHGRTMALASVTDKAAYRAGLPSALQVDYVPFDTGKTSSISHSLKVLNSLVKRYPGAHAGMILELTQGEGGFYPGRRSFFVELITALKEANIPVWVDEIQTMGRGVQPFAFQELALDQEVDVLTFGKMAQVCGTVFRSSFAPKPGLVSQTFTSSTSAIWASSWILKQCMDRGIYGPEGKLVKTRQIFDQKLHDLCGRYPDAIGGPFGHGGMIAFQLGDGSLETTKLALARLYELGLIAFLAGQDPYRIRFLPPMPILEEGHIEEAMGVLEQVIQEMGFEKS